MQYSMADTKKILIAEDEKPMARALEMKFKSAGFLVTVVHDGQSAIDELKKQSFDVALLDLIMPMADGFDVLTYLQKQKSTMPALVSTNLSQEEDEKRAMELGATKFFVKSDTPISQVVAHIEEALT